MAASKLKFVLGALAAAALAAGLAGCAGDPDTIYKQATGYECSLHEGWLSNKACVNRPPGQNQEEVSRYCYATIGTANCFDRPDQDRKNQALGSSGY
jgi:hypothetical protein